MKQSERDFANPSHGTYLLTVSLAQQGYRLSKFCRSLMQPETRAAFKADAERCMRDAQLTEEEMSMIRNRDWLAMVRYGVNHFLVFRAAGVVGVGLNGTGAQMRGESLEEFKRTRRVWEESARSTVVNNDGGPRSLSPSSGPADHLLPGPGEGRSERPKAATPEKR
jgi:protocatechuate 4,5-dioxygenase alpha subunit